MYSTEQYGVVRYAPGDDFSGNKLLQAVDYEVVGRVYQSSS
jgi:hypothetical protein